MKSPYSLQINLSYFGLLAEPKFYLLPINSEPVRGHVIHKVNYSTFQ